jgi:hypothetical protein
LDDGGDGAAPVKGGDRAGAFDGHGHVECDSSRCMAVELDAGKAASRAVIQHPQLEALPTP